MQLLFKCSLYSILIICAFFPLRANSDFASSHVPSPQKKGDEIYVCLKVQGTNTATPSEMTFWREGVSMGGEGGVGVAVLSLMDHFTNLVPNETYEPIVLIKS